MTSAVAGQSGGIKDKALGALRKVWGDFRAFTPGQKAVTVTALLAVIIGGVVFSKMTSKTSYAPLYTNLAASDASAIVDKLTSAHVSYKLADGGAAILVPQKDVYAQRLAMSSAGLPSSTQRGFSLLKNEGITTSEFAQHVDYQQGLQAELDNTIGSISGVQTAQVNLAIPQNDVFTDDSQKPTAAVLLALTPGTTLTTDQVRSVVNLVSSSVPGLLPNNVTVSDASGKVLSAAGSGLTDAGGLSSQTEATQAYDNRVSTQVQQMLDRVLGTGHSSVTVNALLNFDNNTTTSHNYTYSSGVPPIAESSQGENYNGSSAGAGGVLGANALPSATPTPSAGNGNYSSSSVTKNNAVGTIDQTTVAAPGSVKKLNVAVVIDKSAANGIGEDQIRSLVSSAVGIDENRKDQLSVATLPFDTSSAKQAADAAAAAKKAADSKASHDQLISLVKTGGVIVLVLAVIVITAIMTRRRKREEPSDLEPIDELDHFLATLGDPDPPAVPIEPAMRPKPPADLERNRQVVSELASEQPDDMAKLLRNWMNSTGN